MAKAHPEKVDADLARTAMAQSKCRTEVYTQYILAHFAATRQLAPGCDAADLYEWYEANLPTELAAITQPRYSKPATTTTEP